MKKIATICDVKTITSFTITGSQDITSKPDSTAKVFKVFEETLEKSPSIGSYFLKDDVTKAGFLGAWE